MKTLLYFLLFFLFTISIFAADSDLHWTEKIFRSKTNQLVKQTANGECVESNDLRFNSLIAIKKFNSKEDCLKDLKKS